MANEKRLDLIDRNDILPNKVFYVCNENPMASLDELLNRIANAKTVDAVEVVRCAKCHWLVTKGYEEENAHITEPHLKSGFCGVWGKDTQMCNFCSYGEGKEA